MLNVVDLTYFFLLECLLQLLGFAYALTFPSLAEKVGLSISLFSVQGVHILPVKGSVGAPHHVQAPNGLLVSTHSIVLWEVHSLMHHIWASIIGVVSALKNLVHINA